MNAIPRMLAGIVIALLPALASAHSGSASYIHLADTNDGLTVAVSLDLQDAEYAFGLDVDRNGDITWGELLARQHAVETYIRERVTIQRGTAECDLALNDLKVDELNGSMYAVTQGVSTCNGREALAVQSNLMFDLDAGHRTLIELTSDNTTALAVLTNSQREWRGASEAGMLAQLSAFALEGMLHIWSGFDHLAFLLILLLPAFIVNEHGSRAIAWRKLTAIVTAFTLAHSITLALAVSGAVKAPERAIEVAIAASVIIAALTNLVPRARSMGVPTAFAFGLLHGFGFASALEGLGTTTSSFASALVGFNLGVEIGQLVVVAAAFPLVYWVRTRPSYAARVVPAASLLVAILGAVWVWERVAA
jgi:HupE / UreJ protein